MLDWMETEKERQYHEIAQLFPLMQGDEFEQLKADIAANGLREAIWLHPPDGSILDGRNRHRACIETGTKPHFRVWYGKGSLVSFVVSMNLHRRHLTSSQRAAVAVDILPALEKETAKAKAEKISTFRRTGEIHQIIDESEVNSDTAQQAAELLSTNHQYVSDAKRLAREAPELLEQVRVGDKTIPQAKRELTKRQKREVPPLPSDKFRVWYADPPWEYSNSGVIGENDHYGHVERHYPTMSLSDICAMGTEIKERCTTDAVLFLWVPSPILEDGFGVIRAWGFKYKTSFVWDKVRHNFGHYNSVRHEFLLICTRGSCTPDRPKLYDSVQSIERSDVHSEKPEEFRAIVDDLYPHGKRIELFARKQTKDWEVWGNEGIR